MNRVNIGSDNGMSPVQRQAIIRTNAGLLSVGLLGTNFHDLRIGIQSFSFKKMHLKVSSAKIAAILSRGRWVNSSQSHDAIIELCQNNGTISTESSLSPIWYYTIINTLRPGQNGRHFPHGIFHSIFVNENIWTPIKISLKFVPKGPIDTIPALVQIMACRLIGAKPLSEPMIIRLPTHICITRPQWVNNDQGFH